MKRNCLLLVFCLFMTVWCAACAVPLEDTPEPATPQETAEPAADAEPSIAYPTGPVTMVVPYSAGGTTDIVGRALAAALEKQLGQSVVVVNQPGASGAIGTDSVYKAPADGYTLLLSADSLGTQRVMGLSEYSYADFSPIMVVANDPKVIVVGADSPYETVEDLLNDMRERPGKVKMSYTGPGGSGHVQALIYNMFDMDMALTAYSGGGECLLAVLSGQVDFTNANLSTVTAYVDSGELRLLAVSATERLERYPDVPALTEALPESESYLRMPFTPLSLLVSNDVPAEIQSALRDAAAAAVQDESWLAFVADNSQDKLYEKYPDEAAARQFYAEWESLVSWLLYDAGAAQYSPEDFAIPRP